MFYQIFLTIHIVEALASDGGLSNQATQLLEVDYDGRLKEITRAMDKVSAEAKQYFVRANEYNYFPGLEQQYTGTDFLDVDSWKDAIFYMHVWAYSGVGTGQRFRMDFGKGTFRPIDEEDEYCDDGSLPGYDLSDDDEDQYASHHYVDFSDSDESSCALEGEGEDEDWSNAEAILEDANLSPSHSDADYEEQEQAAHRIAGPPQHSTYKNTFTNVQVKERVTFGTVRHRKNAVKRQEETNVQDPLCTAEKSVKATSLRYLHSCINSGQITIHNVDNGSHPEYDEVIEEHNIDNNDWIRERGWARRSTTNMYGKRYVQKYRAFIARCYNEGAAKSSNKMSPSQIEERIQEQYPGDYCRPGASDITTEISRLFHKQKTTGELEGIDEEDEDTLTSMATKNIPTEVDKEIRRLVSEFKQKKGAAIYEELTKYYEDNGGFPACFPNTKTNRQHAMGRANSIRAAEIRKQAAQQKRNLI